MKMICPYCNIEMIMGFEPELVSQRYGTHSANYNKKINGRVVSFIPIACVCPKCKKVEWYAKIDGSPKPSHDYDNLY